jgi:predicted metal-dependent phosphoesterase TrpH
MSVREMLKTAVRRDIQGLAITDHNRTEGSDEARRLAAEAGLLCLRGMELSAQEGHILVYGLQDPVPARLPAAEALERIREQGAFAVAAHPYRFWSGLGEDVVRSAPFEGIEGLNARTTKRDNGKAERLAEELGLPMTAGSDAHRFSDIGRGLLILPDAYESEGDLLPAIRRGRGRPVGLGRGAGRTVRYVTKAVGEWMLRGFRRM